MKKFFLLFTLTAFTGLLHAQERDLIRGRRVFDIENGQEGVLISINYDNGTSCIDLDIPQNDSNQVCNIKTSQVYQVPSDINECKNFAKLINKRVNEIQKITTSALKEYVDVGYQLIHGLGGYNSNVSYSERSVDNLLGKIGRGVKGKAVKYQKLINNEFLKLNRMNNVAKNCDSIL